MTESEAEKWIGDYGRAWESRDPEAAAALFTSDALYYETPFQEPARGREGVRVYWANATGGQRDVHFRYEMLGFSGDRALARWWARFERTRSGEQVELEGIVQVTFAPDGRCRELREWWHSRTDE